MLRISNSHLSIVILDPVGDRSRLGPRFCAGGYIYQVEDAAHGPLFSGPEYPSPTPSVTNGQGMPDVFQFTLYHSPEEVLPRKMIIGVGMVENSGGKKATESHFHSSVEEFATWRVRCGADSCEMTTEQSDGEWGLTLCRLIELTGRGWVSTTEICGVGGTPLPFRWFAHPFFPLNPDRRCGILSPGHGLEANPGFLLEGGRLIRMNQDHDWNAGCFTFIRRAGEGIPFRIDSLHPSVGGIRMETGFVPSKTALWGNARTFSPEPFVERTLAPGETFRWSIRYSLFPL